MECFFSLFPTHPTFLFLKFAVTVGIDDGVHSLLLLAQGAVTEAVGLIIRHILPGENGVDRNGMCLIYRAENRVDGADFAAVILDTLDTLIQGFPVVAVANSNRIFLSRTIICILSRKISWPPVWYSGVAI